MGPKKCISFDGVSCISASPTTLQQNLRRSLFCPARKRRNNAIFLQISGIIPIFAPRKQNNEIMEDNVSTTASEPTAAYGTNSYADVMYMLHTMSISPEVKERVARRLTLEVTGKNLSKAFARLDHLATLERDWDGEGALPISKTVINNLKRVLTISDDEDWKYWLIGPDSNATLGLQAKTTKAAMSIGADEFSYYARINGKRYGESHVRFSPEYFLKVMREIS